MPNGIVPPIGRSPAFPRPVVEQPRVEFGATETYSENILGPVRFWLYDLHIVGSVANPAEPVQVSPANKPQIVERDEQFILRVSIHFNDTPLTRLLLCLGTQISVNFCAEGCGSKASEVDLVASTTTKKDQFDYVIEWTGSPATGGMTPGFYAIAAVANIGPVNHDCARTLLLGAGYVAAALLQVYEA